MLRCDNILIRQDGFELQADLVLEAGRKAAVIGPSGAGKSTLLLAIAGYIPLAQGRIIWRGQDITLSAPGVRPIAMLFQDNNLFPHLSVEQNVGLGLRPDMRLTADDRKRVASALERVGLAGQSNKRPGNLSGGQQSRAALARVLLQDRPLLLLDEPFSALGPALRADMLDLVADLVAETGASLMMVTHAPEDARRIADDLIFVADGKAHPTVPAAEALNAPSPALQEYLG